MKNLHVSWRNAAFLNWSRSQHFISPYDSVCCKSQLKTLTSEFQESAVSTYPFPEDCLNQAFPLRHRLLDSNRNGHFRYQFHWSFQNKWTSGHYLARDQTLPQSWFHGVELVSRLFRQLDSLGRRLLSLQVEHFWLVGATPVRNLNCKHMIYCTLEALGGNYHWID